MRGSTFISAEPMFRPENPRLPRPAVVSRSLVSVSNCGEAGIYFLVRAIFVASKLWIWQQFNFLAGRHLNYIFIDSLYHWLALMDYNPRISETRNSLNRFPIPSQAPVHYVECKIVRFVDRLTISHISHL